MSSPPRFVPFHNRPYSYNQVSPMYPYSFCLMSIRVITNPSAETRPRTAPVARPHSCVAIFLLWHVRNSRPIATKQPRRNMYLRNLRIVIDVTSGFRVIVHLLKTPKQVPIYSPGILLSPHRHTLHNLPHRFRLPRSPELCSRTKNCSTDDLTLDCAPK